jgi:hypothetical protein
VKDLRDKYGSGVQISPVELSSLIPPLGEIYMNKEFFRPTQIGNRPPGIQAHNLISARVADHARFRKVISAAFSDKAVKLQELIITQYVDLLIKTFRQAVEENVEKGSSIVDIVRWVNFTNFDVISDLRWASLSNALRSRTITLGSQSSCNSRPS